MDFPSIGQINKVIREKELNMVFVVTDMVVNNYRNLSAILPQAEVGILKQDSSNVVELIIDLYHKLARKVKLTPEDVPDDVSVKVFAKCNGDVESETDYCDDVEYGLKNFICFKKILTSPNIPTRNTPSFLKIFNPVIR